MAEGEDTGDKPYEPTQRKLDEARKKGEVAKSTDLFAAAGYAGILIAAMVGGPGSLSALGELMTVMLDQSSSLAPLFFDGPPSAPMGGILGSLVPSLTPWFAVPAMLVVGMIVVQRCFVVTPSKLQPKLSRIDPIQNAKNKYGRNGLFEFFKSFVKLLIYSLTLAVYLKIRMPEILGAIHVSPAMSVVKLLQLTVELLFVVLVIALAIGAIDFMWQHQEHMRKHRMTHKELQDEAKESEGDPHVKQARRAKAQSIARNQMLADVPQADVVIVNPTHYAVALKWSRKPGEAPECVAKGVDEIARKIREIAMEEGVPIHSDPPTARALHASVEIGEMIPHEHYRAVAAAIRFAEDIRRRARARGAGRG